MARRESEGPLAPKRDGDRGGVMAVTAVENHYCPNCKRTRRFRRSEELECLQCGRRLHLRRPDESR